ncbi:MAG: DEAD/DEAH box helicase family protein [Spirochaetes bacterium]|uniref:DNA 5'-3' helicase n=1 Tax=Candidatus Ornithospirochaeta stercoripullorum TaxID=2840899 RepID=A0A9D9DZQ4_9SPIO|nr:DEAD/DEAH box helicase family protein [Candidatus Ornithospirochaeta stercoripullorum]
MISVEDAFSPGGALDKAIPDYSFREGQYEMAMLVERALLENRHAIIEAGTGTGKSYAYLVPVFLSSASNESRRFIITTSTITLQKQLYDKDIPAVKAALGLDTETAILYGRGNYLCIRRFNEARNEKSLLKELRDEKELLFEKWTTETESGVLQDMPKGVPATFFYSFASDDKDCLGYRCPYAGQCWYYNARRQAQRAKVIVTNHHLLLLDAKNRAESELSYEEDAVLPGYSVVVMDEAHHIEAEATDVLSRTYSSFRVGKVLDYLTRKESRFGSSSIIDFLSTEEKERGFGKNLKNRIAHLRTMLNEFNSLLKAKLDTRDREVLFTPEFYREYRELVAAGEGPASEMDNIGISIQNAYSDEPSEANEIFVDLIKRYGRSLALFADTLRDWIRFSSWNDEIPYSQVGADGDVEIHLAPMNTGAVLSRVLVSHLDSMIFSSATLSVNGSFEYFEKQSGLWEERDRIEKGIFQSPFEYRKNLMLLLPRDASAFSNENTEAYTEYVTAAVKAAIESSGGGALVLFTSKKMMKEAYLRLRDVLPSLLVQDERTPRSVLFDSFRKNKDSSLFAVSSFWEGVDAPGDTLRLVVIVKLPFTVPSTPIVRARSAKLEKDGSSSFMEMTIPDATLRLKQGLGRLIRTESDRGVVLILDGRITRKGYGRIMISSLPDCYIPEDAMLSNIGDKIERFLY